MTDITSNAPAANEPWALAPKYPGVPDVINGNGAVAYVMKHVCGGVIGYPITPSTEISETFEAFRAEGQINVWGKHPFFVETEGEHSAQSGALGAALTGGNYISNASSSQGILYGLESHYVTAGRKVGGFVLQVAARVVSRHSLNVMAGHDDVYALLPAGYTILFGANPQEAADLAAISYKTSALSLVPVANAMDGFATSHVMSEMLLPEPQLLKEYLGDPTSYIPCPTVAQEVLFGAKGRVFSLQAWVQRHARDFAADDLRALRAQLELQADLIEGDNDGLMVATTNAWVPQALQAKWRRAWLGAHQKGTRQLVPALVDQNNPGLTGPVQNQPDFQAGTADHRTHFASAVPRIVRMAMAEYGELTGRHYSPVMCYNTEDADYIMVGLGSITEDVRAVIPYLRQQGLKVGVAAVKLLQPFPEAELIEAVKNAKAVTVLERSDDTALTRMVTSALFKARANADNPGAYPDVPAIAAMPRLITAFFGLGGHDVQPRHLIAGYKNMASNNTSPLIYLGTQFFDQQSTGRFAELEGKMRAAYPETQLMALETEPNPVLLPPEAMRVRFHSVGGYGTIATGKLLTDILAGMLNMHSKSAPKYGSEKSGAATNYYITLSPEVVLFTNNDIEDVEVVMSPDHMVFRHTNPLRGLAKGGTFILQSDRAPLAVWRDLPGHARQYIRENDINFRIVDAFHVARKDAPTPELETRMMGIAFIGAMLASVPQLSEAGGLDATLARCRDEIVKKFGRKGDAVVESNMHVISDGMAATVVVDYNAPEFREVDASPAVVPARTAALSASMCPVATTEGTTALFDPAYYEDLIARPFREGTISEAPAMPGTGLFMPPGTGAFKDKGLFRRQVPLFNPDKCTGCLECAIACPDSAIPNTVHEIVDIVNLAISQATVDDDTRAALSAKANDWAEASRAGLLATAGTPVSQAIKAAAATIFEAGLASAAETAADTVASFPLATPRPFFAAVEKATPGQGGLYSVVTDPWKCTGCLECVDVCGPHALLGEEQKDEHVADMQASFELLTKLPNTPERFSSTADGDLKRLLLDHANYYSIIGGHGACRGCGEVTATHLVTALSRSRGVAQNKAHTAELEDIIDQLYAKESQVEDAERRHRIGALIGTLEARLYLYEGGPTGNGPAPTIIANSTGCSSVYSSTLPSTQFIDPWVNTLFQDAQPVTLGIYEGLVTQYVNEIKALRAAALELADDPEAATKVPATLSWRAFTDKERALLPTVMSISGDGAAYDIGFGALSRVLAAGTPVKILVLDTGSYSNTGGQASTASFTGQDSDLARYGRAHAGKAETRKELGLLAAFHPHVFSASTSAAFQAHFLDTTLKALDFEDGGALMVVYTPCSTENGIADELSNARSQLAVQSRLQPMFVHDPRGGDSMPSRFSLKGNPGVNELWINKPIQYVDDEGKTQLLPTPLTPAEFALGEVRWAKQFKPLAPDANGVPIADYVELADADREGKTPFVYATDKNKHLIKVACAEPIVILVEDRKRYWQTLQYLAGVGVKTPSAPAAAAATEIKASYDAEAAQAAAEAAAAASKDATIDAIAEALVTLVTSKKPDAAATLAPLTSAAAASAPTSPAPGVPAEAAGGESSNPGLAIWLDPADEPKCSDCATCYQELPDFFEKRTIIVDGEPLDVAHFKEGSLDGVEVTDEMRKTFTKIINTCDSEILQ